jgi:hypothetical protein
MADPAPLTRETFEILAVRELRKAGFEVGKVRIHRRSELPEPERGFVLELLIPLGGGGRSNTTSRCQALVVCRSQTCPVEREVIESLKARLSEAEADAGIVFATADFAEDALAAAREHGIALLRVIDGRTAFDTSGWGTPGHYPAWLPSHTVQVVLDRLPVP